LKFAQIDRKYLTERASISKKYGPRELWSIIDHWPLYCGLSNLARFVAILEIVRRSLPVPGHIAELGSWRGANLLFIAKLMRIFDPNGSKEVHCFDSFEGLQTFSEKDCSDDGKRGTYLGNYDELLDMISLYDMKDEIVIHKGFVNDTLPKLFETRTELSFSLVYLDMDLYEPTIEALNRFHPRLSKGGILIFDEWNTENYPGETLAVREFLDVHGGCYRMEHVQHTRQPSLMLVKEGS
jgi:hypothetical protein